MTESAINQASTVKAAGNFISSDLDGEVVILHPKSGEYYGLNAVGREVWNLVQEPMTVAGIRDALVNEFEVELERCESDLIALLQELESNGLVEIAGPASP